MPKSAGLVVRTDTSNDVVEVVVEQEGRVIDRMEVPIGATLYPRITAGLVNQMITGMRRYADAARVPFEVRTDVVELLNDLGSKLDDV